MQWDLRVMLAWSFDEAAKYIQIFKSYENKGTNLLQENKKGKTHEDLAIDSLTSIKSIQKKDAKNLLNKYGSIAKVVKEKNYNDFQQIEGIGSTKVECLIQCFKGKINPASS